MPKIDLIKEIIHATTVSPGAKTVRQGANAASGERSKQAPATGGSQVKLSAAARQLLAGNGAPVDSRRVDAVRTAIANGTYQVGSKQVANDIAASVKAALAASRKKG